MFDNFFFFENHTVYEKMWRKSVERGRQHMKIQRMRTPCWIPRTTNTHTICNIYCFYTASVVARKLLNDIRRN